MKMKHMANMQLKKKGFLAGKWQMKLHIQSQGVLYLLSKISISDSFNIEF